MAHVKRKKNETFESMFRRFNNHLRNEKKVQRFKEHLYFSKPLSRNLQKVDRLFRLKTREKFEYLRRTGQIDPTSHRSYRR